MGAVSIVVTYLLSMASSMSLILAVNDVLVACTTLRRIGIVKALLHSLSTKHMSQRQHHNGCTWGTTEKAIS